MPRTKIKPAPQPVNGWDRYVADLHANPLDVVDRSAVKVGDVVLTPAGPRTVAKSFKAVHLGDTWILHYADGAWSAARCLYPTMLLVR